MKIKNPELWKPKGVEKLEFNAEKAIKTIDKNIIITAGPGAGKTELLAQKACYLLETNFCKSPSRILAISFKKDAAKNLKDRVELRVGKELGKRFDSFTFDAFSTNILTRFRKGLPEILRPTKDYKIDFTMSKRDPMRDLIFSFKGQNDLTDLDLASLNPSNFERDYLCKNKLLLDITSSDNVGNLVAQLIWNKKLHLNQPSELSFNMIGRLAELILRKNPLILNALRQTYTHVFLDEFQDTTKIQYDLLTMCFQKSAINLTAVGDNKQRIMGWAGALENIFDVFEKDFQSEKINLENNYRSAPSLVKIQHTIIKELEGDGVTLPISSNKSYAKEDGGCKVFKYPNEIAEANHLAETIEKLIKEELISPREICILTRQKPEDYTLQLIETLNSKGIEARLENEFQDLLTEPLIILIYNLLKLVAFKRDPDAWTEVLDYLLSTNGHSIGNIKINRDIEIRLEEFVKKLKRYLSDNWSLNVLLKDIVAFLNINKIKAAFPQYKQEKYWKEICNKFYKILKEYLSEYNLKDALYKFEGKDSIPIMTMHKSKGLEYHTVFFIGLEDSILWGYKDNPIDETNGFFVAFSRAKSQIYFTFCEIRNNRNQKAVEIDKLYSLLTKSDVPVLEINSDLC